MKIKDTLILSMKPVLFAGIGILLFFVANTFALDSEETFPSFKFESYDGTTVDNEVILKLQIKLIIYGTPNALSENRTQLDQILEYLKTTKHSDQLLYTINFSSYPRLIRGIIKGQMKNNAEELGISIYADWNGFLCDYFDLDPSCVTLFLIDNKGSILESFCFKDAADSLKKINKLGW